MNWFVKTSGAANRHLGVVSVMSAARVHCDKSQIFYEVMG